jgi:hypothetical protein
VLLDPPSSTERYSYHGKVYITVSYSRIGLKHKGDKTEYGYQAGNKHAASEEETWPVCSPAPQEHPEPKWNYARKQPPALLDNYLGRSSIIRTQTHGP